MPGTGQGTEGRGRGRDPEGHRGLLPPPPRGDPLKYLPGQAELVKGQVAAPEKWG